MKSLLVPTLIYLWIFLTGVGCSVIIPKANYTWSENYALHENGGLCSVPEMNDGNLETYGRLGLHSVSKRTDTVGGAGVYDTELKIKNKISVKFTQKRTIDKIVIHANNLGHWQVYWQDDDDNWQLIESFRDTKEEHVVIETHVQTDAILIDAKPQKPFNYNSLGYMSSGSYTKAQFPLNHEAMRFVLRDENDPFELRMEGKISEIEVYGKIPIDITK